MFNTGVTAGNAAVAIGDVLGGKRADGTSIPDLVTVTPSGGLNIAGGYGDGTFQSPIEVPFGAAQASLSAVKLADLDGNGKLDIIVAGHDDLGNGVWVLLNQGTGSFGAPTPYQTGSSPVDLAVADLGNGHLDIITANVEDSTVTILFGDGHGNFDTPQAPRSDYFVDFAPTAVVVGHFFQLPKTGLELLRIVLYPIAEHIL